MKDPTLLRVSAGYEGDQLGGSHLQTHDVKVFRNNFPNVFAKPQAVPKAFNWGNFRGPSPRVGHLLQTRCGIIHADIKPDNILISAGHNVVGRPKKRHYEAMRINGEFPRF